MHSEPLKSTPAEIRTSVPLAGVASFQRSSSIKNQLVLIRSVLGFSLIESGWGKSRGLCVITLEGQSHFYLRPAFPAYKLHLFSASVSWILTLLCMALAVFITITSTGCNFALLTVYLPCLSEYLLLSIFCNVCHSSAVAVTVCMSKNRQWI